MDIKIRKEESSDIEIVYQLVKEAFMNEEYTDHDEHNLVNRLRESKSFIPELSLVAVINQQIVGYILFTKIKIKNEENEYSSLALAPVSVIPDMQGKGIGKSLIKKGHQIANELGFKSIIVLGHPGYYHRFGYIPASQFGINSPFEVPDNAFMAIALETNNLYLQSGTVIYPEEFFN